MEISVHKMVKDRLCACIAHLCKTIANTSPHDPESERLSRQATDIVNVMYAANVITLLERNVLIQAIENPTATQTMFWSLPTPVLSLTPDVIKKSLFAQLTACKDEVLLAQHNEMAANLLVRFENYMFAMEIADMWIDDERQAMQQWLNEQHQKISGGTHEGNSN